MTRLDHREFRGLVVVGRLTSHTLFLPSLCSHFDVRVFISSSLCSLTAARVTAEVLTSSFLGAFISWRCTCLGAVHVRVWVPKFAVFPSE